MCMCMCVCPCVYILCLYGNVYVKVLKRVNLIKMESFCSRICVCHSTNSSTRNSGPSEPTLCLGSKEEGSERYDPSASSRDYR